MTTTGLITNSTKAFVIATYLRELREAIGLEAYLTSAIRNEHGGGKGFFGISNTGSNDCLKETLRRMTDGLDLSFRTHRQIRFASASCQKLVERNKKDHVVEHTIELIEQFYELERKFILGDELFTPNSLAKWFIKNQIVCLVEKAEQTGTYSAATPFKKYSVPIYCGDVDVSDWSHDQIREFTLESFADYLELVHQYDFSTKVPNQNRQLISLGVKHRLPPLDLAIRLANDEMRLLDQHYHEKVFKVTTPGSRYFSQNYADRWREWKSKQ